MKIENVVKKFDKKDIYLCPKCSEKAQIEGIMIVINQYFKRNFQFF